MANGIVLATGWIGSVHCKQTLPHSPHIHDSVITSRESFHCRGGWKLVISGMRSSNYSCVNDVIIRAAIQAHSER